MALVLEAMLIAWGVLHFSELYKRLSSDPANVLFLLPYVLPALVLIIGAVWKKELAKSKERLWKTLPDLGWGAISVLFLLSVLSCAALLGSSSINLTYAPADTEFKELSFNVDVKPLLSVGSSTVSKNRPFAFLFFIGLPQDILIQISNPPLWDARKLKLGPFQAVRLEVPGSFNFHRAHIVRLIPRPGLYQLLPEIGSRRPSLYTLTVKVDGRPHLIPDLRRQLLYFGTGTELMRHQVRTKGAVEDWQQDLAGLSESEIPRIDRSAIQNLARIPPRFEAIEIGASKIEIFLSRSLDGLVETWATSQPFTTPVGIKTIYLQEEK